MYFSGILLLIDSEVVVTHATQEKANIIYFVNCLLDGKEKDKKYVTCVGYNSGVVTLKL